MAKLGARIGGSETAGACQIDWKRSGSGDYLVTTFVAAALTEVCLAFCMLREQLVETLELGDASSKGTLFIGRQSGSARSAAIRRNRDRTTVQFGETELEMLLHFLPRTLRDGIAEVDHVDVDAIDRNGTATSIVLKFPVHATALSSDEVRRRLSI